MTFIKGDNVEAKYSDGYWYAGTIAAVAAKTAKVTWEDGTVDTVKWDDVRKPKPKKAAPKAKVIEDRPFKLTRKDVGYLTAEQVKAVDPVFYKDVMKAVKAQGKDCGISYEPSDGGEKYLDSFNTKVGDLLLHYYQNSKDRYPGLKDPTKDPMATGFMLLRVTSLDHMRECFRVTNGQYTWRFSDSAVKRLYDSGAQVTPPAKAKPSKVTTGDDW